MANSNKSQSDDTRLLLDTPLHIVAERAGWSLANGKQYNPGRRNNTYIHPQGKDFGSIDITDRSKTSKRDASGEAYDSFIDRAQGVGGGVLKFLLWTGQAKNAREAFNILREFNGGSNKNSYSKNEIIPSQAIQEQAPVKVLDFVPSEEIPFLLERGITQDTLSKPLFKNRFGLSEGTFGEAEKPRYKNSDFSYDKHLVIPYFNSEGEVVNKEYKNKLKDSVFEDEYQRTLKSSESINKVRRNPSAFIAGAEKSSGWMSALTQGQAVQTVVIGEQPADLLAYYQLHVKERPDLDKALYYGIGGNLGKGQIDQILKLYSEHKFKNVEFATDNDIDGFRYAIVVNQALNNNPDFEIKIDGQSKRSIGLTFISLNPLKKEEFLGKQNEINGLLKRAFPDVNTILYASAGAELVRINIPYSPDNAVKIFDVVKKFNPTNGINFEYHNPITSKDWNDKLLNINNAENIKVAHFVSLVDNQPKLLIDSYNNIILHHENLNSERGITEIIGQLNLKPEAEPRIKLNDSYIGTPRIDQLLNDMRKDVESLLPPLNNYQLNEIFNNKVLYSPLEKKFFRKGTQELLATIVSNNNGSIDTIFNEQAYITLLESNLIEAKRIQLETGLPTHNKDWIIKNGELYDGTYYNYRLRYIDSKETVFKSFDIAVWNEEKNGPDYLSGIDKQYLIDNKESISALYAAFRNVKATRDKTSDEYKEQNKLYWALSEKTNIRIETIKRDAGESRLVVKYVKPVATWDKEKAQWKYDGRDFDKKQVEVLNRFAKYKIAGRDLTKPGLIGKIDENYRLRLADGFDREIDLSTHNMVYLNAFEQMLKEKYQDNIAQLRELYPEPYSNVHSSKNILYNEMTPCLTYYPDKNGFILNPDVKDRSFNERFWQQVNVFTKNEGTYLGYDKNVWVNLETSEIFYNQPDMVIGVILRDENNNPHFALFNNVPELMRQEIRAISKVPEATQELLNKKGIDINAGLTKIKNKQKKIEKVPAKYQNHFKGGKFVIQTKEFLKTQNANYNKQYAEAYYWFLNSMENEQTPSVDVAKRAKQGVHVRGNEILYNSLTFAVYDQESDKIKTLLTPAPQFLQDLALVEKQLVKNIANRQFGKYLQKPSEDSAIRNFRKIEQLLKDIDINLETGICKFRTNDFKIRNFAMIDGEKILVDTALLQAFPDFEGAVKAIAKAQKLTVEEVQSLPIHAKAVMGDVQIESGPVDLAFEHNLILTQEGYLKTLKNTVEFSEVVSVDEDDKTRFNFLYTDSENTSLGVDELKEVKGMWLSNYPQEKIDLKGTVGFLKPTLIVCENPEYALLHMQHDLLRTINQANQYISLPGHSESETNELVVKFMEEKKIDSILFVGSDNFANSYYEIFTDPKVGGQYSVQTPPPDLKQIDTLASVKKEISTVPPDKELQYALNEINVKNIYNVAEGIAIMPVISAAGRDKAVVGAKIKIGKLKGEDGKVSEGVYVTTNANPQRATISPDLKETIYYMAINKNYLEDERIVSCVDRVNEQTVSQIRSFVAKARFDVEDNRVSVINPPKYRFYSELSQYKFLKGAITPAPTGNNKSFEEEFKNFFMQKSDLSYEFNANELGFNSLGKNSAPEEKPRQEQDYEVLESLSDIINSNSKLKK